MPWTEITIVADNDDDAFDALDFIMRVEQGDDLGLREIVEGVSHLIRSGVIAGLQGSWQRMARDLVLARLLDADGNVDEDRIEELS